MNTTSVRLASILWGLCAITLGSILYVLVLPKLEPDSIVFRTSMGIAAHIPAFRHHISTIPPHVAVSPEVLATLLVFSQINAVLAGLFVLLYGWRKEARAERLTGRGNPAFSRTYLVAWFLLVPVGLYIIFANLFSEGFIIKEPQWSPYRPVLGDGLNFAWKYIFGDMAGWITLVTGVSELVFYFAFVRKGPNRNGAPATGDRLNSSPKAP
jgi:hypothetical protein